MDSHANGTNPQYPGSDNSSSQSQPEFGQGQGHGFDPRFYGENQDNEQTLQAILPALKQLDIHQIPPDVLAQLLKTKRIDHFVATAGPRHAAPDTLNQGPGPGSYASSSNSNSGHPGYGPGTGQGQRINSMGGPNMGWQSGGTGGGGRGHSHNRGPQIDNWNPNQSAPTYHNQSRSPRYESPPARGDPADLRAGAVLSPLAKEFVPQSHQQQFRRPPASSNTTNWGEMDPNLFINNSDTSASDLDADADCVLATVTDAINQLAVNPADFQHSCRKTTEVLKKYLRDPDTLGVVVTLIFEQSVSNPNFCYSGARLCQAFRKSEIAVAFENTRVTFKNLLIERCQEEFTSCLEHLNDPEVQTRTPGVIMFLAELYLNFVLEVNGKSSKNTIFGSAALELMTALIASKPVNVEKIRTVFRTLKLIGWDLDHESTADVKHEMEKLMKELSYLMTTGNMDSTSKNLLETLFDLRKKDWNKAGNGSTPSPPQSQSEVITPSPSQYYELPDTVEDEDYNLLIDDEPEEVRRAYEEFLQMTSSVN